MEECRKTNALHFKYAAPRRPDRRTPLRPPHLELTAMWIPRCCLRYSPVSPCDAFSVALQRCLKGLKEVKKHESQDKGKRSRDRMIEAMRRAKAEEAALKK